MKPIHIDLPRRTRGWLAILTACLGTISLHPGDALTAATLPNTPPTKGGEGSPGCVHTLTIQPGPNAVGNACHDAIAVGALMPNPPLGTTVHKWDYLSQSYQLNVYATTYAPGWWDAAQTIAPGEAVWITNPSNTPFTITFSSTQLTPALPLPWTSGAFMACRQIGSATGFEGLTGFSPPNQVRMYVWNGTTYDTAQYYGLPLDRWMPAELNPAVGDLVWIVLGPTMPNELPTCSYLLEIGSLAFIANQCHNDNQVATLFPGAPLGVELWKYNNDGTWSFNQYNGSWSNPTQTLAPGEGAIMINPSGETYEVMIAGFENTPVLPSPYCASPGCYLLSRQSAAPANFEDIMGCSPQIGTVVYRFNGASFDQCTFMPPGWICSHDPIADVGEAVWVHLPGGTCPSTECRVTCRMVSSTELLVCWNCDGCHLEGSTGIAPTSWSTVSTTGFCATIPAADPRRFFRLVCP